MAVRSGSRSRRGSFGLQPRVSPDVNAQVVALAREYVAKRDSNIMDAWKNGGTFEGKKATDDMVLAYWNERAKGLDPGDPDYEAAKNQVMQLQYAVAQSKADLLHVQGKMSDNAYAQFFLKWAQKVPTNSEFYRTLQKDAAQLIQQAKARGAANANKVRTDAFNAFVKSTTDNHIAVGDALTKALNDLSKSTGMSITGNGDELLGLLTQDVHDHPDQYRALLDTLHKADPSWNGQLTEGYFTKHINDAVQGYALIADRAQKAGFVSAYASATQGESSMSQWGQNVHAWPVAQTYTQASNAFQRVWNDGNMSQMDRTAAANTFANQIDKMLATPGLDEATKVMLTADAARLRGQPAGDASSFGTAMLGRNGIDPTMAAKLANLQTNDIAIKQNPELFAYAPVDPNGAFDPTGNGPIGIVSKGAVPPGAQAVMVPGANGQAVMAYVVPHSVYTTDPNNPNASPQWAGYQISYNVGGHAVQMWSYTDTTSSHDTHWTLVSPLDPNATTKTDSKGDIYVTPASTLNDPVAAAQALEAQFPGMGSQLAQQLAAQIKNGAIPGGPSITHDQYDSKGHLTGSVTLTYANGQFSATQKTNTLDQNGHVISSADTTIPVAGGRNTTPAYSAATLAAGDMPGLTYSSPLSASVDATKYTQTQDQVGKFASDPQFQQEFLHQTMNVLGTNDVNDPRIAAAWQAATTPSSIGQQDFPSQAARAASQRTDLVFPGGQQANPDAYNKQLTVNFGGQQLTIPGLPSYMQNQTIQAGSGGSSVGWATASPLGGLLANLPQTQAAAATGPTVTPTGTPTYTPSSHVTPTVTPPPASVTPTVTPPPGTAPGGPTNTYNDAANKFGAGY